MQKKLLTIFAIATILVATLFGTAATRQKIAAKAAYLQKLAAEQAKRRRVTFREGLTRREMADILKTEGFTSAEQFYFITKNDEGHLFPDTYELLIDAQAETIRQKLLDNYAERTADLKPSQDQLILASIVEREASGDGDRSQIAGVYANRLKIGMKLEADPTVQYAKYTDLGKAPAGKDGQPDYWAPITRADYGNVNSPYNTYLHAGLPPTPICNPGKKSIEAAIHPATTDALFFFHTKSGEAIFSKTLIEHQQKQKELK